MLFVGLLSILSIVILYVTRNKLKYSIPLVIVVYSILMYYYLKGGGDIDIMLDDAKFFD